MPTLPRFRSFPTDSIELERILRGMDVAPDDGSVTDESFVPRSGNSIMGRAAATNGTPADIGLSIGEFLVNRSGVLRGDGLVDADIPSSIARDSEVTAAQTAAEATAAAALAAHVADSDPHPTYTTAAELASALSDALPTVSGDYANDAAAAAGGVAVGELYHSSGAVKIRLA